MTFYFLLQECNYDWNKAKNILYSLNDLQIQFINYMNRKFRREASFGSTSTKPYEVIKSFNLRNR